jgi:hypothetical protein
MKKITSFEMFKEATGVAKTDEIVIKTKSGEEVVLMIKELPPSQMLSLANENDNKVAQFESAIEMICKVVINDKKELIFDNEEAISFLKDNFVLT